MTVYFDLSAKSNDCEQVLRKINKTYFNKKNYLMFELTGPEMGGDEQDVPPELHVVVAASRQAGACQRHLLYEDREAVAGGGEVEL